MNATRENAILTLTIGLLLTGCGMNDLAAVCTPGAVRCQQGKHIEVCSAAGDVWTWQASCASYETCADGVCLADCTPACAGQACGDDGCGGSCGACEDGYYCWEGQCLYGHCEPECIGKACGDDGCGGECGPCQAGYECDDFACKATCAPSCVGKDCGADGCGGTCGVCEWPQTCTGIGSCECIGWCSDGETDFECGPDGCGGECGGGCAEEELCVNGACFSGDSCTGATQYLCGQNCCDEKETCKLVDGNGPYCCREVENAACVERPDGSWEVSWLDTCGEPWLTVEICEEDCAAGTCQSCAPKCAGLECGADGCGGSCGTCPAGSACVDGLCEAGACVCADGVCCDGCDYLPETVICDSVESEGCEAGCGGDVVLLEQKQRCSGHDADCSGVVEPEKIVGEIASCGPTETCETDSLTCKPNAACQGSGCQAVEPDAWDTAGANGTLTTASYAIEQDGKVAPADLDLHISGTLHASDDTDWYQLQTEQSYSYAKFSPTFSVPTDVDVELRFYCWGGSGHVDHVSMSGATCTPDNLTGSYGLGLGHGEVCVANASTVTFQNLRCGEEDWGDLGWSTGMRVFVVVGPPDGDAGCGSYAVSVD